MAQDPAPSTASEPSTDLGHLASAVGHHVINAFSAIVSNAEMLQLRAQTNIPLDPAEVSDLIIRTALRASGVARRLIDYTRPLTAIGDATVSLDRLAAEFVESQRARRLPGVTWAADLAEVPPITGHRDELRKMLGYIVENSLEAMPTRGGTITLATSTDDRGWVVLEVRDSGSGMAPHVAERAIEPFFSTKGGHLGVGLSIANGIWRRHRGAMSVHSQPGRGTEVRLGVDPDGGGPRPR